MNRWNTKIEKNSKLVEYYVDGKWIILDTAWDSGYIEANLKFHFSYGDTYFKPTADEFAKIITKKKNLLINQVQQIC